MHQSVMDWVKERAGELEAPVLEVGGSDVNGSVRWFCPTPYVAIDIEDGPGVDLVYDGVTIPFDDASQSTVICTEVFEHVIDPVNLANEICRVLASGGRALITARGNGFPLHNPPDRWRFMPGTLAELFSRNGCRTVEKADPMVPGRFVDVTKAE